MRRDVRILQLSIRLTLPSSSFFGLILVTHSDSLIVTASSTVNGPRNPLLGDMLALLSAFCYAIYVILLKVRIGDEERIDMQLFFG